MYWLYAFPLLILILWIFKWFVKRTAFKLLLKLSEKAREKLKITLDVSKIHLTYLEDVSIEREGFVKVKIDYIGFSSKWINSACNKPFCLLIGPSTVNILQCSSDEKKSSSQAGAENKMKDKVLLNNFTASMINLFMPYFGVATQTLSITFWVNDISIVWSCERIFLDTSARSQSVCIGIEFKNCNLTGLHDEYPVLFISHNLTLHCFIPPGNPISAMSYKIDISKVNLDVSEELLLHIQRISKGKKIDESANLEIRTPEENTSINDKYGKLKSVLELSPECVKLSVENFKVVYRVYRQGTTILDKIGDGHQLQFDCHCILSWQRESQDNYETSLDVLGFAINGTNQCKLILLKKVFTKLQIDLQKEVPKINFTTKIDNCHFDFIYNEIIGWQEHFEKFKSSMAVDDIEVNNDSSTNVSTRQSPDEKTKPFDISKLPPITVNILFENCSCDVYRTLEEFIAPSLASCYLGRFCVNVVKDETTSKIMSTIDVSDFYIYVNINIIMPESHFSLPCQLEDDQPSCMPSSERHAWGRFLELGKMTHEVEVEANNIVWKSNVTYISCEWSLAMGLALKQLFSMVIHPKRNDTQISSSQVVKKRKDFPYMLDIEVEITNINLFSLGDKEGGYNSLLIKFDSLNIATGTKQKQLLAETKHMVLSQLTELQQLKTGDTYFCCSSEEYKDNLLMLPVISICLTKTEQNFTVVDVSVCETTLEWKPNLHMALYEQIKDFEVFAESIKDLRSTNVVKNEKPASKNKSPLDINIAFSLVDVKLATAPGHSFGIKSKSINLTISPDEKKISCPEAVVKFDDVDVFEFQAITIHQLPANKFVAERQQMKLNNPTNNIWSINIKTCSIWFPYKFHFAESLEKFQVVIKMLKLLHKKPKPKDYVESLPPDLFIMCNFISIQFDDDPFEVRLGDNYMLLSDEIEQAIERERKLETKLEQIKSEKGTMLSGKKVDELRRNLREKNAQIYIDRSKEMYEDRPIRKVLFRIILKGLQLSVFADESLHGQSNVLKHMSTVDPDSPIPDDIQFTTLWCRMVTGKIEILAMEIRDYPTPLLTLESFSTRGMVIGSEACGAKRATRTATVHIGSPWEDLTVVKNMPALKFYYDLKWDMGSCQMAWGANYEPTLAMISQSFDLLSKPSVDPSIPMPFWDKIRLLLHGKLRADIADWNILLSASTNPFNTTETLKIEWNAVTIEWTNGNVSIDGDFDLLTRTASKYDDSRVMHFPDFNMTVKMDWLCAGDCNDHHSVYPTHPDYVNDKEHHDSFKFFRSRNVDMSIHMDTSIKKGKEFDDLPSVFLYASTFRWFQNYQVIVLSRVSRPIKRGFYFKNTKPRKPTLGRHLKILSVEFSFPSINATYWGSFQKDLGFEASFGAGSVSAVYQIHVSPHPDMLLIRRPVAEWIMRGLHSSLQNVRMLLLHSVEDSDKFGQEESEDDLLYFDEDEEEDILRKHYLFSVNKVTYQRQSTTNEELFMHKILLENFKGAWTAINRELTFRLLEAYSKMQDLKKVLSTLKSGNEASEKRDNSSTPLLELPSLKKPLTRYTSGEGISLLQKLVSEQSSKFIAQSEEGDTSDLEIKTEDDDSLDILQRNWHIEFINSQVLVHGTETKGSIMLTSANATVLKRLHCPVFVNTEKLNKVTWSGRFRSLQYFSTIQNFKDLTVESIPWLTDAIIAGEATGGKEGDSDLPFFKSSESTGSLIEIKKKKGKEVVIHHLQRVIARCECEFKYISLGDELDAVAKEHTIATPIQADNGYAKHQGIRESLTLTHSKLELSTSPSQYAVIADICQNLIFYTEPKKKEEQDRLEKLKFKLQLSTGQNLKGDVSQLQHRVRNQLMRLRHYERELFEYRKRRIQLSNEAVDIDSLDEVEEVLHDIQEEIEVAKEQLFTDVEELKILINAYTDVQETVSHTPSPQKGFTSIRKRIDVTFDDMQWLLTQKDGQLGIATVYVKKFRYNQLTYKDERSEHCYEVGHFVVKNLLPNEIYREALIPHEVNIRRHLDKSVMLRIFTSVAPAVAGIMVKEHFEINVCPIAVRLTYKLVSNLESFFFGKTQGDSTDGQSGVQGTKDQEGENAPKSAPFKIAPPRPPPPRPPAPSSTHNQQNQSQQQTSNRASFRRKISGGSDPDNNQISARTRRPSNLNLQQQAQQGGDPTLPSPSNTTTPVTPKSGSSLKRVSSSMSHRDLSFSAADRDVNLMKERASKNQTFIYIKIPEVPVLFSYKGEKDITITDANNFNLCLPTLEYHSRTWTWQDLFQALKKDYIQTLVPQILKEKLHLKSAGADTKPSLAQVDDTNKAKLLFGEKQAPQKKSTKKMLFGKFIKPSKSSSSEKLSEASGGAASTTNEAEVRQDLHGKGVEPSSLEHQFNKLRDFGDKKDKPNT